MATYTDCRMVLLSPFQEAYACVYRGGGVGIYVKKGLKCILYLPRIV